MKFAKTIMTSLLALTSYGMLNTAHAEISIERCGGWGDSLDAAQAEGRREWAKRCDPSSKSIINGTQWWVESTTGSKRRAYPIFGISQEAGEPTNPANYFAPITADAPCNVPEGYSVVFFCAAGCYTADQMVLFEDGYQSIKSAHDNNFQSVVTLNPASTVERMSYKTTAVDYYTTDHKESLQPVIEFTMESGGKLRVTPNHPLVDSDKKMRTAESLKIGEALLTAFGKADKIVSATRKDMFGKVYNLSVESDDLLENVVVAQGYLNGSLLYQNEGIKYLNQVLLRTSLIPDAVLR